MQIEPKYLFATFNVVMLIISFMMGHNAGHKAGIRDAYNHIMKALGVPEGHEITSVQYRRKQQQ